MGPFGGYSGGSRPFGAYLEPIWSQSRDVILGAIQGPIWAQFWGLRVICLCLSRRDLEPFLAYPGGLWAHLWAYPGMSEGYKAESETIFGIFWEFWAWFEDFQSAEIWGSRAHIWAYSGGSEELGKYHFLRGGGSSVCVFWECKWFKGSYLTLTIEQPNPKIR